LNVAETVYALCALTSIVCAGLLVRNYRRQRTRLVMWSMWCFVGLAINNVLMFVDLIIVPDIDLALVRSGTALAAFVLLLIGLLWEDS
jgi:hypothetical protein